MSKRIDTARAVFLKELHKVLVSVSETYHDIREMNDEILPQSALEDNKNIERSLDRLSVNTIEAIYMQTLLNMHETYGGLFTFTIEVQIERDKIIQNFVELSVEAFNLAAIEQACKSE